MYLYYIVYKEYNVYCIYTVHKKYYTFIGLFSYMNCKDLCNFLITSLRHNSDTIHPLKVHNSVVF